MPQLAIMDAEIEACFDVMAELRPHLERSDFLPTVRGMEANGYRLIYIVRDNKVVAATFMYTVFAETCLWANIFTLTTLSLPRSKDHQAMASA